MASFHGKIGWKWPRKRENKNDHSDPVLHDAQWKIPKKQQKSKKNLKKIPLWLLLIPKQVGKGRERAKIKIIVPICCYPTLNRKFHKSRK